MKNNVFINGIGAVTAQGIWRTELFEEASELNEAVNHAQQPSYKEFIAPAMSRRMSRGIKMGIYAAQQALDEAEVTVPDAIITGTGLGCSEDSEKFLRNILDNQEEFLTPTSFIQSTHNTVAAQIALRLQCKGYNFTYVNRSISFESALLDALLQLQQGEEEHILVGGVDEVSDHTFRLLQLIEEVKASDTNETVKTSVTPGVNYGEGATFFSLGVQKTRSSYAELVDIHIQHRVDRAELPDFVAQFLERNTLAAADVDALLLGYNGDSASDSYYVAFEALFPQAASLYYKHLSGQYDACSAFGLAAAASVLQQRHIPSRLKWKDNTAPGPLKTVLLYNQLKGKDHALTLIRAC
ncbi:beta-ketoacyl synthase chain length factor [Sphingobacterium griseoflavum]|uniref:3-oxoacyl-ACP synthase n=1 Tax=Sphingobacterium griseoflavum TaxID=1474952 RepID=A0ABQ3HYM7_9SPHI|nr:beta-ketoacyl synthase chain length factor [Sphingobacterium griseoflavum]GHE40647.1 3-oxoacyl-ACP synthase [Sphingobacterium griseoflavum]